MNSQTDKESNNKINQPNNSSSFKYSGPRGFQQLQTTPLTASPIFVPTSL